MTTQPSDSTRNPCKHVKLSRAAGSVLIIFEPLTIGLNASKHLIPKPTKINKYLLRGLLLKILI